VTGTRGAPGTFKAGSRIAAGSMAGIRSTARRLALVALAVLLLAGTGVPPASGSHHAVAEKAVASSITETVVLPENNYTVYTFSLWIGETITYDIRVTNGSAIDVYFLPPDGLNDYASDLAVQFRLFQQIPNARTFQGTFGNASGDVSVVIDNVDLAVGGATPEGSVTVAVDLHKNPSLVYLGAAALIAVGVVLLVAVAIVARRRARRPAKPAAPPPPRPYEKPLAPPDAPSGPGKSEGPPPGS
jgi:hypothetical protein